MIIYLLSAIFNYAEAFIMATVNSKFTKKLRNKIGESAIVTHSTIGYSIVLEEHTP